MIKVAIFPGYGINYIPPFIREQLTNTNWIRDRIKLVEIIQNLPTTHAKITQAIYDEFESDENTTTIYIKAEKDCNSIYVKDFESSYGFIYKIQIVEVDTTKKWKIGEYDGAEGIEYFNEPVIIDEELNYAKW